MKTMRWTLALAALVLSPVGPAWGAEANNQRQVTVNVNDVLSITDEVGNFTLTFATDFAAGSTSTGQTVVYTVRANNMTNSALTGAVSAKISSLIDGITLKGDPGDYTNEGTGSNATLVESAAGFIAIGTTASNFYDKPSSSGSAGKILKGKIGVHYRAFADRDLSPGEGGTRTLTVTLKNT